LTQVETTCRAANSLAFEMRRFILHRKRNGRPTRKSVAPIVEQTSALHSLRVCIVPTMRDEKKKRQFIFSTHNANIPVLGDAEQIVGLTPVVEGGIEHATIPDGLCGSIDTPAIKEMIKDLLEGGQEAFEFRKQKYGF
jgi:hypothetical protein